MSKKGKKQIKQIDNNKSKKQLKQKDVKKKKGKKSTKNKVTKIIIFLILLIVCLLGIIIGIVVNKLSKLETVEIDKDDLLINTEVKEADFGDGYLNVALFGGDSRSGELEEGTRTDSIIVASLNNKTKEVKLVSVYRDTLLNLSNGSYQKCNAAYSIGGPLQAINMLNTNLDLDIEKYVTVDFSIVTEIIDILGGVEIEIDESEIEGINEYIPETARVAGKEAVLITEPGIQLLDGVQATTYARIRSTKGGDFKRTDRQRYLIEKIVDKLKRSNLFVINNIIDIVLPRISTNFTANEIAYYATAYLDFKLGKTTGFPEIVSTANIPGKGSVVIPRTLESNVTTLHDFLYGNENYLPSENVKQNSQTIINMTQRYINGSANSNDTYETHSENSVTNDLQDKDVTDVVIDKEDNYKNPVIIIN